MPRPYSKALARTSTSTLPAPAAATPAASQVACRVAAGAASPAAFKFPIRSNSWCWMTDLSSRTILTLLTLVSTELSCPGKTEYGGIHAVTASRSDWYLVMPSSAASTLLRRGGRATTRVEGRVRFTIQS